MARVSAVCFKNPLHPNPNARKRVCAYAWPTARFECVVKLTHRVTATAAHHRSMIASQHARMKITLTRAAHAADPAVAEMFQPDGKLCRELCTSVQAALRDSRASDTGLFAALSALLSDPGQLEPSPVVMASQMFPPAGSTAGGGARGGPVLPTQASANPRPPGAAARLQEQKVPQFSSHAAVVDVLPEGCEDSEPFLSMHVAQTLQVLMCALGGLRQLRLLPDEVKRACGDVCHACVKVLEGVYDASDKLCAPLPHLHYACPNGRHPSAQFRQVSPPSRDIWNCHAYAGRRGDTELTRRCSCQR